MTMAPEPADDDDYGDVFSSEREDRGGKDPASSPEPAADTGPTRDERGRFAAKSQDEPAESQPQPEQQAQQQVSPEQQPPVDPNANRHVPLSELKAERKRRQELERLHMESEARAKAYEQMFQQQPQRQQPQPQPQEQAPDPFTDPEGFYRYQARETQRQILNNTLNLSESFARRHFGSQIVDEAVQAAQQAGVSSQFLTAPDPYAALVEWHKREKALAKFGTDPEAYEKQLEEQIRQKVLAELKAGGAAGQQPQQRFPGTLATATATGTQGAVLSDEAVMGDVFGSDRRSRRQ